MKCWFCTIRDAVEKHVLAFEMYGDIDTKKTPSETKVAYNVRHVEVPRCADCHSRHQHALLAVLITAVLVLSLLVAILFAVYSAAPEWVWALWSGLSAGLLIGAVITRQTLLRSTCSVYAARKNYPDVKELCEKGYKFGKRPKDTLAQKEEEND